ncbi:Peroxisomal acyl-coenzyme A oxidase 1 [Bienertia sinuspersici]
MKTVSQLGSGKQPVGTIAYMGRAENLMQSQCTVKKVSKVYVFNVLRNLTN